MLLQTFTQGLEISFVAANLKTRLLLGMRKDIPMLSDWPSISSLDASLSTGLLEKRPASGSLRHEPYATTLCSAMSLTSTCQASSDAWSLPWSCVAEWADCNWQMHKGGAKQKKALASARIRWLPFKSWRACPLPSLMFET